MDEKLDRVDGDPDRKQDALDDEESPGTDCCSGLVGNPLAERAVFVMDHIDGVLVIQLFSLVPAEPVLGFVVIDAS